MGTETKTYTNDEPRKKIEMTVAEKQKGGQSEAIRGHQRRSEAISDHKRRSEAIRANHGGNHGGNQPPEKRKGGPESRYGRVGSSVATAVPESATAIRLSMTEGESTCRGRQSDAVGSAITEVLRETVHASGAHAPLGRGRRRSHSRRLAHQLPAAGWAAIGEWRGQAARRKTP